MAEKILNLNGQPFQSKPGPTLKHEFKLLIHAAEIPGQGYNVEQFQIQITPDTLRPNYVIIGEDDPEGTRTGAVSKEGIPLAALTAAVFVDSIVKTAAQHGYPPTKVYDQIFKVMRGLSDKEIAPNLEQYGKDPNNKQN